MTDEEIWGGADRRVSAWLTSIQDTCRADPSVLEWFQVGHDAS
jgi:hypothetical protein